MLTKLTELLRCSALALHSHNSHNELRKVTGLGHAVKPQPDRPVWLPAAERRRRKRKHLPKLQPESQQEQQHTRPFPLPKPWQKHFTSQDDHVVQQGSAAAGLPYYWNPETHESRWDPPDGQPTRHTARPVYSASLSDAAQVAVSRLQDCDDPATTKLGGTVQPQVGNQRQQSLDEFLPQHVARCDRCPSVFGSLYCFFSSVTPGSPAMMTSTRRYLCRDREFDNCYSLDHCWQSEEVRASSLCTCCRWEIC